MTADRPESITESTTVSLKLILGIVAILLPVFAAWWHMTGQLRDIVPELRLLRINVADNSHGKLDKTEWDAWIREVRALNLDLRIPE